MQDRVMINEERIRREFRELSGIDSVSFREREMADVLIGKLAGIGFEVSEDHAGAEYGGNAGNLYGFLKGTLPGEPILLAAHMDTVQPGIGKRAVFHEDGRITSDETTILGADDINGIIEILEGIRSVREAGIAHRDIEVLFPIAEELYDRGSDVFDYEKIRSRQAYVLDLSGPAGTAAIQAPSIISFKMTVEGRTAHAGFEPEKGIHAIQIMSRALAELKQGHIDEETTLNVGTISGGLGSNIVPDLCRCKGEVRSYDHIKALEAIDYIGRTLRRAVKGTGSEAHLGMNVEIEAYKIDEQETVVRHFRKACETLGLPGRLVSTFGGSDNNKFVKHGIRGIVLSCGMYEAHSVKEYTTVQDIVSGSRLVAQLIQD